MHVALVLFSKTKSIGPNNFHCTNKSYTIQTFPMSTEEHPKWVKQQELILKKWSEEAAAFRFMHDRSYKRFARLHMNFSLPVIILSTIAGTANFSTGSFPVFGPLDARPRKVARLRKKIQRIITTQTRSDESSRSMC